MNKSHEDSTSVIHPIRSARERVGVVQDRLDLRAVCVLRASSWFSWFFVLLLRAFVVFVVFVPSWSFVFFVPSWSKRRRNLIP